VLVGAKSLPLTNAVQWAAGDKIFITTTTWKDELVNQNEVLTVASVSADGLTVTTVEALQFNHYGKVRCWVVLVAATGRARSTRAAAALLTLRLCPFAPPPRFCLWTGVQG
jgi:hypothetical protein